MDQFDGGFGNTALNDNLGVNITSHDAAVKCRRDVGVQWSDKDIIDGLLEIPKFSKSTSSHLEKSVETRVDGIEQVRKQNIMIIKCFKWDLMISRYQVIYHNNSY